MSSITFQVLSCIPILGEVVSYPELSSLAEKISSLGSMDSSRKIGSAIPLSEAVKEYQIIGAARNILGVALLIAGWATGFFAAPPYLAIALFSGLTGFYVYNICKATKAISVLANSLRGLRELGL